MVYHYNPLYTLNNQDFGHLWSLLKWVGVKTWYENFDPILWNMKLHAAAYMKLNVWT